MRSGRRSLRRIATGGAALAVAAIPMVRPAAAATSCFNVSCATTCTPAAPVGIATLVSPADFPAGATTPVSFVDPNDGRDRRLIATQQGAILVWDDSKDAMLPTMFLDLRSSSGGPVLFGGERGLLSMALDPNYATTGRFYVYYTRTNQGAGTTGDIVIARYQRSAGNPDVADPTATIIMVIEHSAASNHNGGQLAFGPNGLLYISTGDGGGGCDDNQGASGDGQRTNSLLGKILRIDVHGVGPGSGAPDDCGVGPSNYTVPSTNPFFGQEPACDEVWDYGLRNPFRFTFDRATGDMYIGDVGQDAWEELNVRPAATAAPMNFGWACREGTTPSSISPSNCSTTGCPADAGTTALFPRPLGNFWDPPLCHSNPGSPGWASIMAGYRYRGSLVPSVVGDYFYGDVACGQIWKTTTLDPTNMAGIQASCWASGFSGLFGFAEDRFGELYAIVGGASRIDCIHNGGGCQSVPVKLQGYTVE
jgi:glucose/arabinose dehydrogenase